MHRSKHADPCRHTSRLIKRFPCESSIYYKNNHYNGLIDLCKSICIPGICAFRFLIDYQAHIAATESPPYTALKPNKNLISISFFIANYFHHIYDTSHISSIVNIKVKHAYEYDM